MGDVRIDKRPVNTNSAVAAIEKRTDGATLRNLLPSVYMSGLLNRSWVTKLEKLCLVLFGVTILMLGGLRTARGQGSDEQFITGTVLDSSGAVAPGVKVTIADVSTGITTDLETTSAGFYRSPSLKMGEYKVEFSKAGFKTLVRNGLTLHLAEILRLDVSLEVGATTQMVQVTAAAPALNTEDARLGETIENDVVATMPMRDRHSGGLLALAPGVYYSGEDGTSFFAPRFNIAGNGDNVESVDGALAQSDRGSVSQMTLNPPLESVQEVQVQEAYYSAEYGGQEGGMVRMTTKSGTNTLHGDLYEYLRNQDLDTRQFFAASRQPDHYNIFGGTLGGPIKKDKVFFFTNIEGTMASLPTSGAFTVPTQAEVQGNFSALGQIIYDPATTAPSATNPAVYTRTKFQGNVIPSTRFDSVGMKFAQEYPQTTNTATNNYIASVSNTEARHEWSAKFDYQLGHNDQFTGTWQYDRVGLITGGSQGWKDAGAAPGNGVAANLATDYNYLNQNYIFAETHTISPSLINTARVAYRTEWWTTAGPSYDPAKHWGQYLGLVNIAADLEYPVVSATGYIPQGEQGPFNQNPVYSLELSDTVTKVSGKHTLKAGIQLQKSIHEVQRLTYTDGTYSFDQTLTALPGVSNTGNSIASMLLGDPTSATITQGGNYIFRRWYAAPFVTDSVRLAQKLTMEIGLRWDLDFPCYDQLNAGSGFDPLTINPVSGTRGVITFEGEQGWVNGFFHTDKTRLQPRLGFAYRLNDKTSVRWAYGIYAVAATFGFVAAAPTLGYDPANVSFSSTNNGLTPAFQLAAGFPAWPHGGNPALLNNSFGAVAVGQTPTTSPTFVDTNWRVGNEQTFNISIERELPSKILFEVAGIGELGRRLPENTDTNQVPSNLWGLTGNSQVRRPFPQFGTLTEIKAPWGTSDYYGLDVKANKRLSNGLLFLSSFNWQKTLGVYGTLQDPALPKLQRGVVQFQQSNNPASAPYKDFKFVWTYDLPVGPGKHFLESGLASRIFGGWNVGGVWVWYGGFPFTMTETTNSLNCQCTAGTRLNQIGPLMSGGGTVNHWFNTAAVAPPAFGQVGTMGISPPGLVGPDERNLDASIIKTVTFKERFAAKLDWEIFNLTNTTKFGLPGTTYGTSSFGVITSLAGVGTGSNVSPPWFGARIMQVGLRLEW